jgi:purine-binding chemotaxis protein CheW
MADIQKYVIFEVNKVEYGLPIEKVNYIEKVMDITSLPESPDYLLGICDIRGEVLPIIDMRIFLLNKRSEYSDQNRIIGVQLNQMVCGLVVDGATDVLDISFKSIQSVSIAESTKNQSIDVVKIDDRMVLLLDIDQLLNRAEITSALNFIEIENLLNS